MNNISALAMQAFLEQNGIYSAAANSSYTKAVSDGEHFPSIVITNNATYQRFCRTVGITMVRPLLNLVFHERSHFQDPWKLANIFRAFGSKTLSLSTVIDLYNHLEDGARRQYVQQYIQTLKAATNPEHDADATLDAFGAFAGLFMQAIMFVESCYSELSGYKYEYYNKLCHAAVKFCDANHLQLEFILHNNTCGLGEYYQVKDLSQITTIACCGSDTYARHILDTLNSISTNAAANESRKQIYEANHYTQQPYLDLLHRVGLKPVLFTNQELTKGI